MAALHEELEPGRQAKELAAQGLAAATREPCAARQSPCRLPGAARRLTPRAFRVRGAKEHVLATGESYVTAVGGKHLRSMWLSGRDSVCWGRQCWRSALQHSPACAAACVTTYLGRAAAFASLEVRPRPTVCSRLHPFTIAGTWPHTCLPNPLSSHYCVISSCSCCATHTRARS